MAHELGTTVTSLVGPGAEKLKPLREKWSKLIGEFTFDDIVRELEKPGRDPRDPFKVFTYREDVHELKDLKKDMICPGIVTNVTNFGAFVDIGVHQDGLVHISELSHQFVEDPRKVVNPGDQVQVRVLAVDLDKNQISLSMKLEERAPADLRPREPRQPRESGGPRREGKPPARPARKEGARDQKRSFDGGGRDNRTGGGPRGPGGPGGPGGGKPFNNPFAALLSNPPKK